MGRRAGGYAYRLEFSLSGSAPTDVFFESTSDALTISTVDIDHDNDLDIVAGRPLNGGTVAVWLNDGHGHFTAADVWRFPSAMSARETLDAADSRIDAAAIDASRAQYGRPAAARAVASNAGDRAVAHQPIGPSSRLSALGSRLSALGSSIESARPPSTSTR